MFRTTIVTIHRYIVFCYKGNAEVDNDYGVDEDDDDDNGEQWWCSGYALGLPCKRSGVRFPISPLLFQRLVISYFQVLIWLKKIAKAT